MANNSSNKITGQSGAQQPDPSKLAVAWDEWKRRWRDPITLFTFLLVVVGTLQYCALQGTENEITSQLKEMKADRRPWITFTDEDVKILKPLSFDNAGATIEYTILTTNSGRSVASHAITSQNLYIRPLIRPPSGVAFTAETLKALIRADAANYCSEERAKLMTGIGGRLIAPGGTWLVDSKGAPAGDVTKKEEFTFNATWGDVSAWAPFCIVYTDDSATLHGTTTVLEYVSDAGADHFAPTGQIQGHFRSFGPSWDAY